MTRFRRYVLVFIVIVANFCLTMPPLAHADTTIDEDKQAAITLITTIINAEFNGDTTKRKGHVKWSKMPPYLGSGDCTCGLPNSYFIVNSNNTNIVKSWQFDKVKIDDKTARFDVVFTTVGHFWRPEDSEPQTNFLVLPLMHPVDETVSYYLDKIKGKWYLSDPTFPRIGINAMLNDTYFNIKLIKKLLSNSSNQLTSEELSAQKQTLKILEEELAILRVIAKDKPLHLIAEDNLSNPAAH